MISARSIRVHGVVQGGGFRPFVYRLAREHGNLLLEPGSGAIGGLLETALAAVA